MTDPIENPVWGKGDTDLYHVTEAPPVTYAFFPSSACGKAVLSGALVSKRDVPSDADFCKACLDAGGYDRPAEKKDDAPKPKTPQVVAESDLPNFRPSNTEAKDE